MSRAMKDKNRANEDMLDSEFVISVADHQFMIGRSARVSQSSLMDSQGESIQDQGAGLSGSLRIK